MHAKMTMFWSLYFIFLILFLWEPIMHHSKIPKWIPYSICPERAHSMAGGSRPREVTCRVIISITKFNRVLFYEIEAIRLLANWKIFTTEVNLSMDLERMFKIEPQVFKIGEEPNSVQKYQLFRGMEEGVCVFKEQWRVLFGWDFRGYVCVRLWLERKLEI